MEPLLWKLFNESPKRRLLQQNVSLLKAVRIEFILKVANIRCFILIKCSEQKARFKKSVIML